MNAPWSGWHIRRNEVICEHRFYQNLSDDPFLLQLNCTVEQGTFHLQTFIHFLARPSAPEVGRPDLLFLGTDDGSVATGWFPVLSTNAPNRWLVVNVPSRVSVNECLRVIVSGKPMVLRLATDGNAGLEIPLANDDSFRKLYVKCRRDVETSSAGVKGGAEDRCARAQQRRREIAGRG